jgi:predicted amino acid racemase
MLLDVTLNRNPSLIEAAVALHRCGRIAPNTYVIDLDVLESNARLLATTARDLGMKLYFVTKQFGRNPLAIAATARHLPLATAIDFPEALRLRASGAGLGNVGHLVQIPERSIAELLTWKPEVVTVYSYDKAASLSRAATAQGMVQRLLLRVTSPGDEVFPGQEGGIPVDQVVSVAHQIEEQLPGVAVEGVTSFPCLAFDPARGAFCPTPNLSTLRKAREALEQAGIPVPQLNAPSGTCVTSLPLLRELGVTHGEPGHALTGSTPLHAADHEQPEVPAMIYVSEVSHVIADGRPAVFGGGFYRRGNVGSGLVFGAGDDHLRLRVTDLDPSYIDYYRVLERPPRPSRVHVGDTVVFGFRAQVFVTNSQVAVIARGSGEPELLGTYDPFGRQLDP